MLMIIWKMFITLTLVWFVGVAWLMCPPGMVFYIVTAIATLGATWAVWALWFSGVW